MKTMLFPPPIYIIRRVGVEGLLMHVFCSFFLFVLNVKFSKKNSCTFFFLSNYILRRVGGRGLVKARGHVSKP